MTDKMTAASFSAHLHTKFRASLDPSRALELELMQVAERPSSPRQVQFSILFRGPVDTFLPQGMYLLEHESLGRFEDLFIVPVAKEWDGYRYEAVFNHLIRMEV